MFPGREIPFSDKSFNEDIVGLARVTGNKYGENVRIAAKSDVPCILDAIKSLMVDPINRSAVYLEEVLRGYGGRR